MARRVKRWRPVLKTWTENAALKATNSRFRKIDELLIDIGGLWGDVDEFIVGEADQLRRVVEIAKFNCIESAQTRAEEREQESPS